MLAPPPRQLAFLTIGQAPRHDLSDAIEQGLPAHIEVRHAGVLDGLDRIGVEANFAPTTGRAQLISRLADGSIVTLCADAIGRELQHCIDRLEDDGVDVVVLLCTGEFPGLRTRRAWLVEPDAVVCGTVASLLRDVQAGVIVPMPGQEHEARDKWRILDKQPLFAAGSPYASTAQPLVDAAKTLQAQGAHALVLDCMGYSPQHKQALRDAGCNLPVLVSGSVLGGALGAFL
ncbi:AroM family protein [Variovorax dokdonensis]|uniref:AroM family protein n=1 Tax=Variovorax dokdonensis TaxID=344883 RepID=A0ABT7NE07_9BURK|nr:AroM family protein [Variovorax dokdonensis]MDM0046183.1 AroM family protein [Variovorax dokdonensis]